jgi:phosphopantetheinyl transferase
MIFLSILRHDDEFADALLRRSNPRLQQSPNRSRQSLIAEALLHDLLSVRMKIPSDAYQLMREKSGRPLLCGNGAAGLPSVSLTHSNGWIGCAASHVGDIGLDLEWAKPGRDVASLAGAAFGPQETAAVHAGGDAAFYRIWTLREAWSKACGVGFSSVIDRQDHVPLQPTQEFATTELSDDTWCWLAVEPYRGLYLALALRRSQRATNHSTVKLRKCHFPPDLTFSNAAVAPRRMPAQEVTAPIGSNNAST